MNYIIVGEVIADIVEKICTNLSKLYGDTGFVQSILVYRLSNKRYKIEFPNNPDFERFAYFVNYFRYPEGFDDINPTVFGVWTVDKKIARVSDQIGEKLVLFVSQNDKEYDNVSVLNAKNEILIYGFDGKITSSNIVEMDYLECVKTPTRGELIFEAIYKEVVETKKRPWWKFW